MLPLISFVCFPNEASSLLVCLFQRIFEIFVYITASATPPSVSGQSYNSTSISVQWTFDNSTRNVLGALQGFHIYYVRQDGRSFQLVTTGADESSLTLIGLRPYTRYNVSVSAFTMTGKTNSSSVAVRTQQDGKTTFKVIN